jgi:hypothetical protein
MLTKATGPQKLIYFGKMPHGRYSTIFGGAGGNLHSAGARLHLTQGDGHWPQFPGMYNTG